MPSLFNLSTKEIIVEFKSIRSTKCSTEVCLTRNESKREREKGSNNMRFVIFLYDTTYCTTRTSLWQCSKGREDGIREKDSFVSVHELWRTSAILLSRERRSSKREREREGSSRMKTVEHFAKQTNRKYVGGKTTQGRHGQEGRRFSLTLSFLKISLRVFNHSNGHVLYTKWYLK